MTKRNNNTDTVAGSMETVLHHVETLCRHMYPERFNVDGTEEAAEGQQMNPARFYDMDVVRFFDRIAYACERLVVGSPFPATQNKLDENGAPVRDAKGKYVYEPKLDDDGNPAYDFKYGVINRGIETTERAEAIIAQNPNRDVSRMHDQADAYAQIAVAVTELKGQAIAAWLQAGGGNVGPRWTPYDLRPTDAEPTTKPSATMSAAEKKKREQRQQLLKMRYQAMKEAASEG